MGRERIKERESSENHIRRGSETSSRSLEGRASLLVFDIPEYEIDLISSWTNLSTVHANISPFVVGWSSDSDEEIDVVNDSLEEPEGESDEIMMVLGYPFFPLGGL